MDAFPRRTDELPRDRAIDQAFGIWPGLIGAGLLATAALVALGENEALALPKGIVTEGILVALAVLFLSREIRKRRRRITLALGSGEVAIYRRGELASVLPLGAITSILLDVGTSLRNLFGAVIGALIPGVVALHDSGVARLAGATWAVVLLVGALSDGHTRFRCRHVFVPIDERKRRIALRAARGDALLAALPRTGNWQVAE